ncbi:MAG TPA: amidohydrolase family protein [Herbaspirillum sp.]
MRFSDQEATVSVYLSPLENPSSPSQALPAGACDAHCHIFGPSDRFPYAATRSYTPTDAPYEKMIALQRHLGISRAVIVQANCHGSDHAALLDALRRGQGAYRGVALLPPDVTEEYVRVLHEAGVRAARFSFVARLGMAPSPAAFDAVVERIAPFGWHVCLYMDAAALKQWMPRLAALPIPFVIDHMARIEAVKGTDDPDFQVLLDVAKLPNGWVKVSGIDRISAGRRPFLEGLPCVARLIEAMPERVLWGTDWPHPNVEGDMPDDGELVDAFFAACPDQRTRRRILVDNPARLYGFDRETT